jgi:protein-tyrosine phosphatase
MGNICRSPLAAAIFRQQLADLAITDKFIVDSAGTCNYHVGEGPDERAILVANDFGIELRHTARQFTAEDFTNFDYILVMDHLNYDTVLANPAAKLYHEKVFLLRTFDHQSPDYHDVPDPYYGVAADFHEVGKVVERSCLGFLNYLRKDERLFA